MTQETAAEPSPPDTEPSTGPVGPVRRSLRGAADLWARNGEGFTFLVLAVCQAGTVALTWQLWSARAAPPPLPVIEGLPAVPTGWLMLLTLAVALWRRRTGTVLHVAVVAYAAFLDQTRLQPEFMSLAILLVGVAFRPATVVGRAHLATLWTWSGVHKLLSTGFADGSAVFIANGLGISAAVTMWATPLAEIALGLLALSWKTRRLAVVMAVVVHSTVLFTLIAQDWNSAVWLWNIALPFAAAHFLLTGRERHLTVLVRNHSRAALATAAVWMVAWSYPAGFYIGAADAYVAHNLYTSNTREATVCHSPLGAPESSGPCVNPFDSTWIELNVPLPPETRLYRQWFEESCTPGSTLRVVPIQTRINPGGPVDEYPCPDNSPDG